MGPAPINATRTKARGQEKRERFIPPERYREQRAGTSENEHRLFNAPLLQHSVAPVNRSRGRSSWRRKAKKYSPPHPLDTKGCCSPQNNPKKSSSKYCPSFQVISNDLFVDCTNRFTCKLHELLVFRQRLVTYWMSEPCPILGAGDLSTFHPSNCFPGGCRLPIRINSQQHFACKLLSSATAIRTWIRSF